MINTNHTERFGALRDFYVDNGAREGGIDGVNGDWVVWVCSVAGDVCDDGELAIWVIFDVFECDEGGTWFGEVYAIDKDVGYHQHIN